MKKDSIINFNIEKDVKERIVKKADETGLSLAAYIRMILIREVGK